MKIRSREGDITVRCECSKLVPLAELRPHPKNPNRHPKDQVRLLARLIRHHGWRVPIIVSKRSGCVVAGHARLEAAQLLEIERVPVDVQDFPSEADELAFVVADNKVAELSSIGDAALRALLKELEAEDIDAELAGVLGELADPNAAEAEYPICPQLNEHYDYVLVFTDNDMDFAFLKELFQLETVRSYKKSGVGLGRVIPFKQFHEAIVARRDSFHVESRNDDHPPAHPGRRRVRAGQPGSGVPPAAGGRRGGRASRRREG